MRLKIAENMVRAVSEAPHVTALFEADFSAVAEHKAVLKPRASSSATPLHRQGGGRGDGGRARDQRPWEEDRIAVSPTIDVGVGTALGDKGLVVPVVKDAGRLKLDRSARKLDDLTAPAREAR